MEKLSKMMNLSSVGRSTLLQGIGGGQSSESTSKTSTAKISSGDNKVGNGHGKAKGHSKGKAQGKALGHNKVRSKKSGSGKIKSKGGSKLGSKKGSKSGSKKMAETSLNPMAVLDGLRAKVQILPLEAPVVASTPVAVAPAPQIQQPVITQTPVTAVPAPQIQQPVITQTGPALIQDTTFLNQPGFDPTSTAGQIAIRATNTPIVQTGDPVTDRINSFLRTTNILLNASGSQSVGGSGF